MVVHGNHPIYVALTVILRLLGVLKISTRQSNSMLKPTNACELQRRSSRPALQLSKALDREPEQPVENQA